ncbi:CPBP family intramembrane glutamic endopeptidase [Microbacterium thalassium]|uniref:Membrane protease YdiL (CAAX protease family) n=1 Tax=Microbacterium thalassium TaxID=362649 RepID=A0A7X0KUE3_9MICO|nr:type II CAAX endopeptidase family protein [Microbacterium thalassium]MBB6391080.1 membrane protease YdiL (CAAX protease family) [Microbacterium thalassium]
MPTHSTDELDEPVGVRDGGIEGEQADLARFRDPDAAGAPEAAGYGPDSDAEPAEETPTRRSRSMSSRRTDWRLGGRTTSRWRELVLGVAILALGAGVLIGAGAERLLPASVSGFVATGVLWVAMGGTVLWAFLRSRPAYLLRFSPKDLVWGLGLGLIVRTCQGWIDVATGGTGALPSYPTIGGALPDGWVFTDLIAPVVVAPVLEEFFFRAVVLVSLYTILRRPFGKLVAGLAAGLVSTGLFVLGHWLVGANGAGEVLSVAVLGVVCSALVLLTGRIWGAVLVHVVYNASFVVLALAGTWLG